MRYVVKNICKDGKTELYVTHHQLENGSWRSKKLEDARRFISHKAAQDFINRMRYPSTFLIETTDL